MLESILQDIKRFFLYGNMVTKIILAIALFYILFIVVLSNLLGGLLSITIDDISFSSSFLINIQQPWVIVSGMLVTTGFWVLLWSMLIYYWMGSIVGDLIGDNRILPIFVFSGLVAIIFFMIGGIVFSPEGHVYNSEYGFVPSVLGTVVCASLISPNYNMRLFLLGKVPIKYIALVFVAIPIIGLFVGDMQLVSFCIIGGAVGGWLYMYLLRNGIDVSKSITFPSRKKKSPLKVIHRRKPVNDENQMDEILDKISSKGIDSLSAKERNFLESFSNDKNEETPD